jgi:hypothetical protein
MKKKDSFHAKIAFILSLGFWIPLFNVALSIVALWLAATSIRNQIENPKRFGGFGFALTAIILSVASIVLTIIGLIIYLISPEFCQSAICTLQSTSP